MPVDVSVSLYGCIVCRFESVEACFNSLVMAPHFSVLIPGEAAEVFHVDHDHPLVLQAIRGGSIDEA